MTKFAKDSYADRAAFQVLLVEDDEAFRQLLVTQLEKLGCSVRSTEDASQFLAELAVAEQPYDLAVVDIQLPGLNGDQIISWVRESEHSKVSSLPVLVVTGLPNGLQDSLTFERSNIKILSKPYEFCELEAAAANLLRPGWLH